MAGSGSPDVLRHSLVDRCAGGPQIARRRGDLRISVQELKQVVRRDIEWLLNSRRPLLEELETFPEASRSLLAYGLPDFTQFASTSQSDCQRICRLIEEALRIFEPRLASRSIKVDTMSVPGDATGLETRFRIRGILHVDPIREAVAFDTRVEMDSGAVAVDAAE
jgi:type VI secretion system protein ImpF